MSMSSKRGRFARLAAWGLLALVVLVDAVMLLRGADRETIFTATLHDGVSYLLPMAAACVLAVILFLPTTNRLERFFWGRLAITFGAMFLGELHWTWYVASVDPNGPPQGHPTMILYVIALGSFASVVIRLTKPSAASPWRHVRLLFDIAAGAWACIPVIYVYWTDALLGDLPGGGVANAVVAAAYPVVGGLIVGSTIVVLSSRTPRRWQAWHWMIAGSLWVFSAALFLYPVWRAQTLTTSGPPPTWFTSLLGLGIAAFVAAEVYRLTERRTGVAVIDQTTLPETSPRWLSRSYPVGVSIALVWVGWLAMGSPESPGEPALVFLAVVLAALLAARSCLAALEVAAYERGAHTDPQTGAMVRSVFDQRLQDAVSVAEDEVGPLSLVIMEVASSERSDGVLGHSSGDDRLRHVLHVAKGRMPGSDGPYLLGSYRFGFILESTSGEAARGLAAESWVAVRELEGEDGRPMDVALGVAAIGPATTDPRSLSAAAHAAVDDARASEAEPVALFEGPASHDASGSDAALQTRMRAFRDAVRGLAQAVDARDSYTREHSVNVSELATALCHVLGLSDADVQVVALAALVHDVGKVGVGDDILLSGDDLTESELQVLRQHPVLGERILEPARIDDVLPIVRHHHERWDGTGYPDGLVATAIPLGARVLAICDAFESATAARAWRRAAGQQEVLARIESQAGAAFDPAISGVFVRMIRQLGSHDLRGPETQPIGT